MECYSVETRVEHPLYRSLIDFQRVGASEAIYRSLSTLERKELVNLIMNLLKFGAEKHEELFTLQYCLMRRYW